MTLIPKLLWNRTSWLGVHYDFLEQFQQIPVLTAKGVSEDNPLITQSNSHNELNFNIHILWCIKIYM